MTRAPVPRLESGRAILGGVGPIPVLLVVTAIVGLPLIGGRVLAGQDIVNYLIHAQQTAEGLRQGVWLPAWSGGYNSGYGSPVLLFFPPLTSYLGAAAVLAGVPVIFGVQWLALVAHFLSGLVAYGWLRAGGHSRSALAGAVVYMIAPYRLVDLYLRSALAEHWAFLWPPLILWVARAPGLAPAVRVVLTAVAVAGLLLSNVPLAVLFGLGLGLWYLLSGDLAGRRLAVASGVALAFGLAAFSLIPLLLSSSLLDLDLCFGSSVPAFLPSSNTLFAAGALGSGANVRFSWMVIADFALVLAAWLLLGRAGRAAPDGRWIMVAAVLCLAATTGPAGPIWDGTPVLVKLQFPWRVTAILVLLAAAMVARLDTRRAWIAVAGCTLLAVLFSGWGRTMAPATFLSEAPSERSRPGTVFPDPDTAWEAGSGGWYWRHEHLVELCLVPSSMPRRLFREIAGAEQEDYDGIRGRPAVFVEDPVVPVRVWTWAQTHRAIEVNAPVDGTLMWRTLWFPEMEVTVDGARWPVAVDGATGLVTHALPAGPHRVDLKWLAFPALKGARAVSAGSLLVVVLLGIGGWIRRRSNIR